MLLNLRKEYHQNIATEIIRIQSGNPEYPNFADKTNKASRDIAWGIVKRLGYEISDENLKGQTTGGRFEDITRDFLQKAFGLLGHLRPGQWQYATDLAISEFDQYKHLAELEKLVDQSNELATALGKEYIIKPDIVIARSPVQDIEINSFQQIISDDENIARYTPFREHNSPGALKGCRWIFKNEPLG